MKIKGSEFLISLMIIVFIGFILFFVASHLAKNNDTAVDETIQLSDQPHAKKNVPNKNNQPIFQKTKPQKQETKPQQQNHQETVQKPQKQNHQETVQKPQKQNHLETEQKPQKQNHLEIVQKPQKNNLERVAHPDASENTIINNKTKTKISDPMESIPEPPKSVRKTIPKDRIIKYENVQNKDNHPDHSLMNKRKKTFGINKSLDLIVKPDEKVQVGDNVAPIKKISERLQLDQGKIIENNIDEPFQQTDKNISPSRQNNAVFEMQRTQNAKKITTKKQVSNNLNQPIPKKSIPIELDSPENIQDNQAHPIPGYSFIGKSDTKIKKIISAISKKNQANILNAPSVGADSLETQLDIYPPRSPKPYETSTYLGIRVVQPGTNIWEIHFSLLKEYFHHKGVTLSPHADEPRNNGESSGIGKILKFSEQLVNIYNLQTQTFEHNLNVIQPLSVIVIYNMSEIFGILDDIDYSVIDRIEFDGESLWIPST